jgi:TPR repeat protein
MKKLITSLLIALLFTSISVYANDNKGEFFKAYNAGDYTQAFELLKPLDLNDDPNVQSLLGYMYAEGKGVTQNYTEAVRWYRLAAAQGLAVAQLNLGAIYVSGRGAPQDYAEAVRLFELAAAQNIVAAQAWMGYMYAEGKGVTQNYTEAVRWYRLAAAQGDTTAKNVILLIESKIEKCNRIGLKLDKDGHCVTKEYVERDDTKSDSPKLQEEAKASSKYYEYKAINEKEFANRKEVETAYDPSGKGGYTPEKISSASTTVAFSDLQSAKKQCAELGFKPKTEKFGSCVLELRKRSQNNQSATIQPQKNPVQSQFKPIGDGSSDDATCQRYGFTPQTDAYGQCRMQIDNAKREMQAQQAQYAEQQKQYQDEVYRQRSLKQAEFFARFGSGETPNEALINTWGNGVVKPRQLPTTRTIILPGGRGVMSCTTTGDVTSCF